MALEKLKLLHQKGIKIIIGTYSSSEAAACKPFADQNNILMISQSSESQSLAIPGDNLFRLIPPVSKQAEAMVKMMQADTILAVFPMVRDDVWGTELFSGFATLFSKAGFYVGDRVLYATTTTEFSGFLNTLDGIVALGFVPYNPKRIAVYLISFSEGETILAQAGNYTSLNQVKWYGSSSFAQNSNVLQNSRAATFAITHRGISSPVLGLEEGARDKWQLLDEQIFAISNDHPDIFSLIAYDILWLAAKTQWVCDYGNGIEQFKNAFTLQADQFYGATGRTALDENGDRASGNFDFWSIRQDAAKYIWSREAVYNTATGQLVRFP